MYLRDRDIPRFWSNVDISEDGDADTCWPWKLSLSVKGYGTFCAAGAKLPAHRVACFLGREGEAPPRSLKPSAGQSTRLVRHLCGNKACCRPSHLATGTVADNSKDAREHTGPRIARPDITSEMILEARREYHATPRQTTARAISARWDMEYATTRDILWGRLRRDAGMPYKMRFADKARPPKRDRRKERTLVSTRGYLRYQRDVEKEE